MGKLKAKVAVITGGNSRNCAWQTAEKSSRQGARVVHHRP